MHHELRFLRRRWNTALLALVVGLGLALWALPSAAQDCGGQSIVDLIPLSDGDGDLVGDEHDNCTAIANSLQIDSDADGYGNLCDPDLNNDGAVGLDDVALMITFQGTTQPEADLNNDNGVGLDDLSFMLSALGQVPGPSSLSCAGTVPCP